MMTPLGMIRSIGKIVRGGAGPLQIFIACVLGVMIGITPGGNLTLASGILLLVLLNANLPLTLLGAAIGKALMYALAPLTFSVGRLLIEDVAGGLFTAMANAPLLALMGLDSYCLVGGLIVGAVVGAVFGLALAGTIVTIRRGVLAARDRSETFDRTGHNIFVRIILRLLFGGRKSGG